MFRTVLPSIEALFASDGHPRQPLRFDWRLIRRKRRPFLLLPTTMKNVRVGLELYAAQRRRAKIWRAVLPLLFKTPMASLLDRVGFDVDADSELMRFLGQQCGVPPDRIQPFAIKFGGAEHRRRLVLLLCDETRRPVSVVKVGLNPVGHEAIDREIDLLEQLPINTLGCIRATGRLSTPALSAFATAYFPGNSPVDDAGLEHLFHAWLNPGPFQPLASMQPWRELGTELTRADPGAWQVINTALAGKTVRTTLQHGDFAPWNIRAINAQNLQVYDWERGQLQGIPGWDWFHFVVQTAILARRLSVQRVAAEVEQLVHSNRFRKYAAEAGISDCVQPLLLAYLLHQKWVVKPLDGRVRTSELFELLSARWQMTRAPAGSLAVAPARSSGSGLRAGAVQQLRTAAAQLSNLFWEPSLTANAPPALRRQLLRHWPVVLLAASLLAGLATAHYFFSTYLLFLPLYLVPCALLTWRIDRRWGALAAAAAAVAGPLIQSAQSVDFRRPEVMVWNMVMRFITLTLCVLFVDQIRRQKRLPQGYSTPNHESASFTEKWAVVLASGLLFLIVALLDFLTNPNLVFLPLYLLPCMILTLVLNLRWGIAAAIVGAVARSLMEYAGNPNYAVTEVFGWNLVMRLAIFLIVTVLLDRIRTESILFYPGDRNQRQIPPGRN